MAGIDKIYGTKEQFDEFFAWTKEHNPEAVRYFYQLGDNYPDKIRPLTNFPEKIDRWMLENCPLKFVTDRITDQYGGSL